MITSDKIKIGFLLIIATGLFGYWASRPEKCADVKYGKLYVVKGGFYEGVEGVAYSSPIGDDVQMYLDGGTFKYINCNLLEEVKQ